MAVNKKIKNLYTGFFDGIETWTANIISNFQEKKYLKKYRDKSYRLTKEQAREIQEFWKPYCRISTKWCQYYAAKNGKFDPRYIPNTIYYTKIDQHFNARKLGYGFNDKNYYTLIFPGIRQPTTLIRKIGDLLFDANYKQVDIDTAMNIIVSVPELIIKPSQESGSGRGICFFKTDTNAADVRNFLLDRNEKNYIVQSIVEQHPALEKVHPGSLNTIRICSLMLEDGVHILSSVLRMGVDKSRIDNVTAGGISAGIKSDGKLDKYAYTYFSGERFDAHPQGLVFENYEVPLYDEVIKTVQEAAQYIGNFQLVSWDMAVDKDDHVLLIEANMRKGGINLHQFDNGPLFGDLTELVLDKVFK